MQGLSKPTSARQVSTLDKLQLTISLPRYLFQTKQHHVSIHHICDNRIDHIRDIQQAIIAGTNQPIQSIWRDDYLRSNRRDSRSHVCYGRRRFINSTTK